MKMAEVEKILPREPMAAQHDAARKTEKKADRQAKSKHGRLIKIS